MKLKWEIDSVDVKSVKDICHKHQNEELFKKRYKKNVQKTDLDLSHNAIWKSLIACLLSSQQKSGPSSSTSIFMKVEPFPLELQICESQTDLRKYISDTLSNHGGIRMHMKIASELIFNLRLLKNENWKLVDEVCLDLNKTFTDVKTRMIMERGCAFRLQRLMGFGPKQSRNLLQMLGLTQYEIPIDSRICKWLNKNGFPFILTQTALQDNNYYNLVSDAIQQLCVETEVLPCLFDAAIFIDADTIDEWTNENLVFC